MAISAKKNVNIEFEWQSDSNDTIYVKFHHTNMGETISLSEDKQDWFDFPANLFSEVIDYLRDSHGLFGGKPVKGSAPAESVQQGGLAPPVISVAESMGEPENIVPPVQVEVADMAPVQSLAALATRSAFISAQTEPEPAPVTADASPSKGIVIQSSDEANETTDEMSKRAVVRSSTVDREMSEEEIIAKHDLDKQLRGFNEGKGIKRL
jgi:hypothetical protein